jgi:hypothetical protein
MNNGSFLQLSDITMLISRHGNIIDSNEVLRVVSGGHDTSAVGGREQTKVISLPLLDKGSTELANPLLMSDTN